MSKLAITDEFLKEVELLELLVKNNVAGMFGGNHKSKSFGSSCEFADFREYMPGDDISKIDWNAFARFDKLYTKQYLDERRLHTVIYIDASRSMDFGKAHKAEQALRMTAVIAYLSIIAMDKVSIYAVRGNSVEEVVANISGKESYLNSIGKLNDIEFDGDSSLSEAILPTKVGYGNGMSVVVSDFLTDNDYELAIDHMISKKRDVLCVQVLSQEELNPKVRGKMHLFDSEDLNKYYRKNINRDIINAYKRALEYVQDRIRDFCLARGADYLMVSDEDSIGKIFFESLTNMGVLK